MSHFKSEKKLEIIKQLKPKINPTRTKHSIQIQLFVIIIVTDTLYHTRGNEIKDKIRKITPNLKRCY